MIEADELEGECWLVTGSSAVRRRLIDELATAGRARPGLRVLGLDELVERLDGGLSGHRRLVRRGEPVLVLAGLLRGHAAELSYFDAFVAEGEAAVEAVAAPLAEALRRLDESGKVPGGSAKRRDLARLLELRRAEFTRLGLEEPFERQRRLAKLLRAGELEAPPNLVLVEPDHLAPARRELLEALSEGCGVRVVPGAEFALPASSSTAYLGRSRELFASPGFAVEAEEGPLRREELVSWLFDGGERPNGAYPELRLRRALDRRDEVVAAAREIKRRVVAGEPLEGFAIVAPDLGPYVALLAAELASRGIPFSLPGGEPLFAGVPSQVVLALLDVLARPGRAELHAYWSHPAVRPPRLPERDEVRRRLARFQQYLPPAPSDREPAEFWSAAELEGALEPGAFDYLARRAGVSGLPRGWEGRLDVGERLVQAWLLPVLNELRRRVLDRRGADGVFERPDEVERLRRRLAELVAVVGELKRLERLRDPQLELGELLAGLRRELEARGFRAELTRNLLDQLRRATAGVTAERAITERRRTEAVVRSLNELEAALTAVGELARFARDRLGRPLSGVGRLRRLMEAELAARSVRVPGPDRSLTILGLKQTAGWRPRKVFLLGLTNEDFPLRERGGLLSGLESIDEPDLGDQSRYLLARLLWRAEGLLLSHPRWTADGESEPAAPFNDLVKLLGVAERRGDDTARHPTSPAELIAHHPAHPAVDGLRSRGARRTAELLAAATDLEPGPVDGLVDPAALETHPPGDESGELSVSGLEVYLHCPRRFFFEQILRVRELPEVTAEAEADVIGSVAHRALELFFSGRRGVAGLNEPWREPLGGANWATACERMLDCAARAFVEVGWLDERDEPRRRIREGLSDASAALDAQRLELVEGLERPEAGPPFGVLKGALFLQRRLIGTLPARVEWFFGGAAGGSLVLGDLRLRGKIDRVDLDEDDGLLSVYDYKTGRSSHSPNDLGKGAAGLRDLQLPLYALAALQSLERPPARVRAAEIRLAEKFRHLPLDDPAQEQPKCGGLHEKVAVGKSKRSWTFDYAFSRAMLDYVRRSAEELWSSIMDGRFHPPEKLNDNDCRRCPFTAACGEDNRHQRLARLLAGRDGGENTGGGDDEQG